MFGPLTADVLSDVHLQLPCRPLSLRRPWTIKFDNFWSDQAVQREAGRGEKVMVPEKVRSCHLPQKLLQLQFQAMLCAK